MSGIGSEVAAQTHSAQADAALLQAVKNKQYSVLSVLLKQHADVNVRDSTGRTPLMWAAQQSDPKAVRILLRHGAKVNAQDHQGLWALWIATERGDIAITTGAEVGIVRQLLQYGARVDLKTRDGETIFGLIAQMERPDPKIVRLLRQARRQLQHNKRTRRRRSVLIQEIKPTARRAGRMELLPGSCPAT